MRVISGTARGIALKAPEGLETRPTTDRIKENVFNLIQNAVQVDMVLDLFSGSGALGIEALSRGAQKAVLVDSSKKCYNIINENLMKTRLADQAELVQGDVLESLRRLKDKGVLFQLVLMDPPYHQGWPERVLERLEDLELLDSESIIVIEHENTLELPEVFRTLTKYKERTYGQTNITIYRKKTLE